MYFWYFTTVNRWYIFTPSQPAPNQGPPAKGREIRRSLTAQDPRHRLPRVSAGKCEQKIVDATPALELAVLTRCEYAKPRKPICEEHRARNV